MTSPQFLAALPERSSWISASAGAGKTKVLIDRVLRLLLNGEPFDAILCLTYTTAAATEVKARLQKKLQRWATLPPNVWEADLQALLGRASTEAESQQAQGLYESFHQNRRALHVQTLHSFCKEFMTTFSFEAHRYGPLTLLEPEESKELFKKVQEECLMEDSASFQNLFQAYSFDQVDETLLALFSQRYELSQFLRTQSEANFSSFLKEKCAFSETPLSFDEARVQHALAAFSLVEVNTQDREILEQLQTRRYAHVFFTRAQTLRKKCFSASFQKKYPKFSEFIQNQAQNYFDDDLQRKTRGLIQATQDFVAVANLILQRYQKRKEEQNTVDFEDLVAKANTLLEKAALDASFKNAVWAAFPFRHIFIDEAQDISPQQWQLTLQWLTLFATAESTLFVVGDIKQSLYSFQGARPHLFDTLASVFQKILESRGGAFQRLTLQKSYRTGAAILNVVDDVFKKNPRGLCFHNRYETHEAVRPTQSFVQGISVKVEEEQSLDEALANVVAESLQKLLEQKVVLPSVGRIVRPEDIFVLLRNRGTLFEMIQKKCQERGLPITGPDKVSMTTSAVWDVLLAFVRVLLFPQDDYALAMLVKSPFFQPSVSEEQLFSLCYKRPSSLLNVIFKADSTLTLSLKNQLEPWLQDFEKIQNKESFYIFFYRALASAQPPFAKIYRETSLLFDTFLEETLNFLEKKGPHYVKFLEYLQKITPKKAAGSGTKGIRFMTVHGSKGLQAPIVFLVDKPQNSGLSKEKWVWFEKGETSAGDKGEGPEAPLDYEGVILLPPATLASDAAQKIRQVAEDKILDENRRLLYVAMTRAQDGLYPVGLERKEGWHALITEALGPTLFAGEVPSPPLQEIPPEPHEERVLFPFFPKDFEARIQPLPEKREEQSLEALRGILIHSLIQDIAQHDCDEKKALERLWHWGEDAATPENQKYLEGLIRSIPLQTLLSLPQKKEFCFIRGGRAEVAFSAAPDLKENKGAQTFRMDHFYVDATRAVIIEVKTTPHVPRSPRDIPQAYQQQLKNYGQHIKRIFPQHTLSSYFLWTETAEFMGF
ncbi:DNA helicase [Alphaproteobacteria bacterium]|nr:DNA helicase [Alphaproteobacteria bacterium]